MEAVLEGIWEIDGTFMHYHERVAYKVLDRPSVHGVLCSFKARVVPMLPPFEWTLSGTWVASTAAAGEKEYTIVFLPASSARTSDVHAPSMVQVTVLKPGNHAGECQFTYLFQLKFGAKMAALERFLPKARIIMLRNHRELVACIQRHHRTTFWRSQLQAELALGGGLDRLTDTERASIEKGRSFEPIFNSAAKARLPWRLVGATCEIAYVDSNPNPLCKCIVTIPAAADAVLEGIWQIEGKPMCYHERVEFRVLDRPSAHSVTLVLRVHVVPLAPPFEWRLSATWVRLGAAGDEGYAVVLLPMSAAASNNADHSIDSNAASALHLVLLKAGARANTTECTMFFQIDLGSHLTVLEQFLPNARVEVVRRHRVIMASIRQHFEKQVQAWLIDVEDDSSSRNALIDQICHGNHVYSEDESALIAHGVELLDAFADCKGRVRSFRRSNSVNDARTKYDEKSGRLIGRVKCLIHASPEKVVAYLMHFDSRHLMSQWRPETDVRYEILEVQSPHHMIVFMEMKTPPLQNRTWLTAVLWQKVSDDPLTYVLVGVPIERHDKVAAEDEAHAVRAAGIRSFRLTRIADGTTKMTFACSLDLKGKLPQWVTDNVATPALLRTPYDIQSYFLQVLPSSQCTEVDGVLLGHLLMDLAATLKRPERASSIRMFVERTATLRECGFAHLDAMFCGIFEESVLYELGLWLRKFKTVFMPVVVAINPATMTAAGAVSIGRGLDSTLRTSATPTDAIDELFSQYPALCVMAHRHVWFRPLLETVAKRRIATAPLGLKLRLTFGALLSIGDMASDIYNIITMFLAGNTLGAFVLLGLITVNLAVQAIAVMVQTAHRGWRVVLWEISILLSLLKPGIDAIRVAGGEERIEGAPFDPFGEMIICKCCELTFESIPGGLAQAIFVLNGGNWTAAAVVSVFLSNFSTAFTATVLTYDLDMNAGNRKNNPQFYGYIPDTTGERVLVFALLFSYHSAWTLGKTFSMAVLAQTNWMWLVAYLIADHFCFIIYKLARGDLIYWVPGIGVPVSLLARFVVKVIVDFTGCAPPFL